MITYAVYINNSFKGHIQASDRRDGVDKACDKFHVCISDRIHLSKWEMCEWMS
jgi:hypothetical protein